MRQLMYLAAFSLLTLMASACAQNLWLEVEAGEYVPLQSFEVMVESGESSVRSIVVDRAASTAVLTLMDGSSQVLPLIDRSRENWPSGCPTNLYSHRMEVIDIDVSSLALDDRTYEAPVIVRNCPPEPERIVLRADGEIGGALDACGGSCLVLVRR